MRKWGRLLSGVLCLTMLSACALPGHGGASDEPDEGNATAYTVPKDVTVTYPSASGATGGNGQQTSNVPACGGFAVSSSSKEATETGMQVLAEGGNAVDAAVAMSYVLGVCEPYSSGLGGSGFMVVYLPDEQCAYSLNYRATAGSSYPSDKILVPGLVMGMEEACRQWGTRSMAELMNPAIDYANNGFSATEDFVKRVQHYASVSSAPVFSGVKEGDTVVQTQLGSTLEIIQSQGAAAFYTGQIAQDIASASTLSTADIADYQVSVTQAPSVSYGDYTLYASDAPSSGITVLQMMKLAETLQMPSPSEDAAGYLQTLKKCQQTAYAARSHTLVDPAFDDYDSSYYTSDGYIEGLAASAAAPVESDPERQCTTQFSVIDGNGMVVNVTNTLSDSWGSCKQVDGFYLNNTGSNFSDSGINAYEAGKQPRTHIAPVIAVGADGSRLAVGSPGGSVIPQVVMPVLQNILSFGVDPVTAVEQSRFVFADDGRLCLETDDNGSTGKKLLDQSGLSMNYYYNNSHIYFGCTSLVGYTADFGVYGVCDMRRGTSAAMYYHYE